MNQRVPSAVIGDDLAASLERLFRWTWRILGPAWIELGRGLTDLAKRPCHRREPLYLEHQSGQKGVAFRHLGDHQQGAARTPMACNAG